MACVFNRLKKQFVVIFSFRLLQCAQNSQLLYQLITLCCVKFLALKGDQIIFKFKIVKQHYQMQFIFALFYDILMLSYNSKYSYSASYFELYLVT